MLDITYRRPAELIPRARNPRTHSKKQIRQIAESIRRFGFTNPILIDETDGVVAGHGRLLAAAELGLETVPTIRLDHLGEAEKRAYVIADNKLAENAGWDRELLTLELGELATLDIDFDLTITGFDTGEIDILLNEVVIGDEAPETAPLHNDSAHPVSRLGDVWLLGDHRLVCGDARDAGALSSALDGDTARMVFTDPPYNVPIDGHVCGLGAVKHREFAMASGEMDEEAFTAFLKEVLAVAAGHCDGGALLYVFMDWRHAEHLSLAGVQAGLVQKNLCVWAKDQPGMGSMYRSQHELVFVFKTGRASHVNNVELGRHGRNRSNVWSYPAVRATNPESLRDLALHPTVKPVALVADAIMDASHRGDRVLDPFGGSGTTLLAAERTGRRAALVELDPLYVDTAVRRWQAETRGQAVRAADGVTFDAAEATTLNTDATTGEDMING